MPIPAGTQLGPYEITGPIGAGGMGEVYRARDTRLGRDVALKVLPADFASDADRLSRFIQEARHAGALNHPNIVAIYDVGTDAAAPYVVMEFVKGESLRAVLQRGSLGVRKLLDIAVQIADGLAAAHAAGIVHRDLKPENVMVTAEGRVKILDFGLARQTTAQRTAAPDATLDAITAPGTVLGTSGYMSPEQARGENVDVRSDLFSFGLVLYEMAAGKKAFERDSLPQTLAAIIGDEAPALDSGLPAPLRWTIDRCLAKEPRDRYDSTRDLFQELRAQREHISEAQSSAGFVAAAPRARRTPWRVAAAVLFVLAASLALFLLLRPTPARFPFERLVPLATSAANEGTPSWSPDGKTVAYVADVEGMEQVFTRNFDSPLPAQITSDKAPSLAPSWSPDGTRLFFVRSAAIWSVGAVGGEPQKVIDKISFSAYSVHPSGSAIAFLRGNSSGADLSYSVWISSPPGAEARRFNEALFTEHRYWSGYLAFSPDGSKLGVWLQNWEGGTQFWILPYPAGTPRHVLQKQGLQSIRLFSWLPDSRHIVFGHDLPRIAGSHLYVADTESDSLEPLTVGGGEEFQPSVSRDGRRLAFTSLRVDSDLFEFRFDGSSRKELLATAANERCADWAPDGSSFAFVTERNGAFEIWLKSRQGDWERPLVTQKDFGEHWTYHLHQLVFAPDGRRIAFRRRGANDAYRLWVTPLSGGTPVQLTSVPTGYGLQFPSWSPDGNWISFILSRFGKISLAKARVGAGAEPVIIKEDVRPAYPRWSPKGDLILYRSTEGLGLISPDGKTTRVLTANVPSLCCLWSKDGSSVYGLRRQDGGRFQTVSINAETGAENMLGEIQLPTHTSIEDAALCPDGNSFVATVTRTSSDLWMLDGLRLRYGLLDRLGWR